MHQLLGKGGMARVYLATQESLGRKVAIKVLSDFGDDSAEQRFFTEARTIAALNHPNIVTIYDVAHLNDGRPYISMEFLSGGDLRKLKGQILGESYALKLVKQVAQGLSAVHKKGIIHRDIKPANILFREDGTVALSDFGIAKDLSIETELTQAGVSVGSPAYSSPEQICGKELDTRTDIYSLGVVLLELLLGRNPFKAETYAEIAINHVEKPLPDPAEVSAQYQTILKKMLAKNPEDRYHSIDEFLEATQSVLLDSDDETVKAAFDVSFPGKNGLISDFFNKLRSHKLITASIGAAILVTFLILMTYESETDKEIDALLLKANSRMGEEQLIEPEFDNARYYFNEILILDPGNGDALDGLEDVDELLVTRYLNLAHQRVEEGHLGLPRDDSAIFYFREALALDENNEAALDGLERVVDECITLANHAFNKQEYMSGHQYIRLGLSLSPDNPTLLELKEKYKDKRNPIKHFIKKVFK